MEETWATGDIIIGVLAGIGVVVLVIVFVMVVKKVIFSKED